MWCPRACSKIRTSRNVLGYLFLTSTFTGETVSDRQLMASVWSPVHSWRRRIAADTIAVPLFGDPPRSVITARTGRQVDGSPGLTAEQIARSTLRA